MQTLRKKTSPCKYRNDPGRFFGDGVTFKAKLIGILEVGEARGDRMCQEALQDLKMAIRAAGEHKQRITIHVTIDGLRLRDEKTGDSLYHHPVHKISFIAQDMTDSRAFGYIFGSPDSGHRFFGIKTDKAASQVVLAMRDLFQVVFELKKKEIEMARQQIQSKTIHEHQPLSLTVKGSNISIEASNIASLTKTLNESSKLNAKEMSPESVADLVDLEQELSSIQRGITQMERITPSEPTPSTKISSEEDPFGDSFTNFPTYNILPPPPESTRSRHSKPTATTTSKVSDSINDQLTAAFKNLPSLTTTTSATTTSSSNIIQKSSDNWLDHNDVLTHFESSVSSTAAAATKSLDINSTTTSSATTSATTTAAATTSTVACTSSSSSTTLTTTVSTQQLEDIAMQKTGEDLSQNASTTLASINQYIDAFTDLDPLGTGKSKPYIDKKYFFHELKNPPKKVLKELSGQEGIFPATFSGNEMDNDGSNETVEKSLEEQFFSQSSDVISTKSSTNATAETKVNNFSKPNYPQSSYFAGQTKSSHTEKPLNIDLERTKLEEPAIMMPRDTDPFSPTRKKSDPFQDGDIFSKLDPFEFEFGNKTNKPTETNSSADDSGKIKKDMNMFNGPLQVNLPPESWGSSTSPGQRKIERQTSESPTSISRNRPSVFKQNTVDVINSISSKKMPHLFGQKFSKRDSNSINMRRLQESDSLSENETAPEPPPRPETSSHIEPPPLPPKKQFSDIVIRPRITSSSAIPPSSRYEYISAKMKSTTNQSTSSDSAPPIPLPSRKVGRTDSNFPGPGRPARKPGINVDDEDYLTPITLSRNDVPPLLPPPQTKTRGRRSDHTEHKSEVESNSSASLSADQIAEAILPDITLSQLLTLGIDELAAKLNVPTSKLSTMTLVELTSYLSEFIENRKKTQNIQQQQPSQKQKFVEDSTPVFKVNFDQNSEATFVAKFDDNFGEEPVTSFVANFSNMDVKPELQVVPPPSSTVPSADRYAVFREIIDQEMQKDTTQLDDSSETEEETNNEQTKQESDNEPVELSGENETVTPMQVPKIDTKITEAISHAKDRYAALRDIILVEDLFEKSPRPIENLLNNSATAVTNNWDEDPERIVNEDAFEETTTKFSKDGTVSPERKSESGEKSEMSQTDNLIINNTKEIKQNGTVMHTLTVSNKDDIEIDELMNRAISNLSLDSRDHLSPNISKSPNATENTTLSPVTLGKQQISPNGHAIISGKSQFNDVSTSPIQLQKSPAQKSPLSKSPLIKSPASKSPIPQSTAVTNLIDNGKQTNSGSLSDVVCGSSPEANLAIPESGTKPVTANANESWAVFDKPNMENKKEQQSSANRSHKPGPPKETGESPCSSDGKDDWKGDQDYGKKWPRGHTSSSSRDLSPWDDEAPDYKKRLPSAADRHGYYMRHARRMNSCDDDYDYEEEMIKRRDRRIKGNLSRSRENFDSDSQNWYQGGGRHNWSPADDEERSRPFDRASYERSTYGPPYDKRHPAYDRREYSKGYDKRKYYREYSRPPPDYDFESYGESPDIKDNRKMMFYGDGVGFEKQKARRDYENIYEEEFIRDGGRIHKSARGEYFYDRDRKSFDRDSVESYESTGRRHKSFGSGDVYGSLDSREDFRERYLGNEKSRSLRKSIKIRSGNEEYDQDSETEMQIRRPQSDTRSLQRPPQGTRIRKSSGSSPWDGEEPIPNSQKGWKRPSSASESERRLADNRRVLCHTLSGSDGEKDKRFRKKPRSRSGKEIDGGPRQAPATRYVRDRDGNYDYIDYEEEDYDHPSLDEDKFERLNRRRHEMHQRMIEMERRKRGDKYSYESGKYPPNTSESDRYIQKFSDAFEDNVKCTTKPLRREFDFEDLDETPRSNASSNKFNFEEHGFESDFNSPPPTATTGSATTKSSFRFSNDFSDKEKQLQGFIVEQEFVITNNQQQQPQQQQHQQQTIPTPIQKLRFDDKVTISKFENEQPTANTGAGGSGAFEDDFSQAEFVVFENDDQWNSTEPLRKNHLKLAKRQDNIKKSESVNIFARKNEDPFEDDDFFKSTTTSPTQQQQQHQDNINIKSKKNNNNNHGNNGNNGNESTTFQWDNNFAKFDENM